MSASTSPAVKTVYLQTDIEGVAGFTHYYSTSSSLWNFHHVQRMERLLTGEINAAVKACKEAGATTVLVNDSHGPGYSIHFEDLDPICRIIHGRGGYGPGWLPLLDETVDAAIAIGMHARAGATDAVCNHSLWHVTDGDGRKHEWSEVSMFAHLCARYGVPLVAISGDQWICSEIREVVPGCRTAEVKQSLSLQNACTLHPVAAQALIYERVLDGLRHRAEIAPPTLATPIRLNVSDRDPQKKALPEDLEGDCLWTLMHEACNRNYAHFGEPVSVDDRSWRYPDSVFVPKS
ncbi:MAG TPA: M55 family metallopeptidase [Chthoniobacteraceae bacterium]|nr:M55 family metallopeptidase [Chthoniobacteraceae bacterium]